MALESGVLDLTTQSKAEFKESLIENHIALQTPIASFVDSRVENAFSNSTLRSN